MCGGLAESCSPTTAPATGWLVSMSLTLPLTCATVAGPWVALGPNSLKLAVAAPPATLIWTVALCPAATLTFWCAVIVKTTSSLPVSSKVKLQLDGDCLLQPLGFAEARPMSKSPVRPVTSTLPLPLPCAWTLSDCLSPGWKSPMGSIVAELTSAKAGTTGPITAPAATIATTPARSIQARRCAVTSTALPVSITPVHMHRGQLCLVCRLHGRQGLSG